MQAEFGVTAFGRRGLDLDGWGELSVWGWDEGTGSLFAQLWHDPDDLGTDWATCRACAEDRCSDGQAGEGCTWGDGQVSDGPDPRCPDRGGKGVFSLTTF